MHVPFLYEEVHVRSLCVCPWLWLMVFLTLGEQPTSRVRIAFCHNAFVRKSSVMAALPQQRRQWAQELRRVAIVNGVASVSDNAARDKIKTMAEAVLACGSLSAVHRASAQDAWDSFRGSFPADAFRDSGAVAAVAASDQAASKEWKFQAAQLTYNHAGAEWASVDKGVLKALMLRLLLFIQTAVKQFAPLGISITVEMSLGTSVHHHIHVYFHLKVPFHRRTLDLFVFEGIHPHVETNKCSGKTYMGGVNRGHYYVVVDKKGSVDSWTDYPPFQAYAVEGWWIDQWYKCGKLDRQTYLDIAARIGMGFQRRLADVRAVEKYEKEQAIIAHVKEQAEALVAQTMPMKDFTVVQDFIALFDGKPRHRRPVLVIVGGTNLGKSMLAAQIMREIGQNMGVPDFDEITVEGSDFIDFSNYDLRCHCGVILDGVGDAYLLYYNRETLQGRPKVGRGGKSATMMYSYPFSLSNRAIIATLDLSASNLDAFEHDHWLSDPQNILLLRLTEKAYDEPSTSAGPVVAASVASSGSAAPSSAQASVALPSLSTTRPPSPVRPPAKRRMPPSPGFVRLPALPHL